jgi:hypothetical protein
MKRSDAGINAASVKEAIAKAEAIRNRSWSSADSLNPHLDALAAILAEAFDIPHEGEKLFDITLILESRELIGEGVADLVAELDYELEDSYGEDWDFESEHLSDVCDKLINSCKKYV